MGNGLYFKLGMGAINPWEGIEPHIRGHMDDEHWRVLGEIDAAYEAEPPFGMVVLAYSSDVIVYHEDYPELLGRHVTALLKRTPDDFAGDNRYAVRLDGIPDIVAELIGQDRLEAAVEQWITFQGMCREHGVEMPDPYPILVNDWD